MAVNSNLTGNELLYERSLATPDELAGDGLRLSRLELWFEFSGASTSQQRIYVDLHRDTAAAATARSNSILDSFTVSEQECIASLKDLLADHLASLSAASKLVSHTRFGLSLKGDVFSELHPPPSISQTAIAAEPHLPRIAYSSLKFLEAREIRPNIRIAKNPLPSDPAGHDTKCIYKGVDFAVDALNLTLEVSNYKQLLAKGPGIGKWLVKLVGLVYTNDIQGTGSSDEDHDGVQTEHQNQTDDEFIGALFDYYPQRDLTTHCYTTAIPDDVRTCWFRQLVCAIAALEEAGFEHWDLKCENIVLDTADGLPDEEFTNHMASALGEVAAGRETSGRKRVERRSSANTTKPSLMNPGKIKIIDLENSKSSASFKPPPTSEHRLEHAAVDGVSADHQIHELGVSMVYALGKTILEIWIGKLPSVGDPTEDEMKHLPEPARLLVQSCCLSPTRISAVQAKQSMEKLFAQYQGDDDMEEMAKLVDGLHVI